jgi:hypothetical protein
MFAQPLFARRSKKDYSVKSALGGQDGRCGARRPDPPQHGWLLSTLLADREGDHGGRVRGHNRRRGSSTSVAARLTRYDRYMPRCLPFERPRTIRQYCTRLPANVEAGSWR